MPLTKHTNTIVNTLLIAVFVCYAVLVLGVTINHESWADEAQAWLLVRDNTIAELFRILPSEGHPPLWYLILMPSAKTGIPYQSVKFIAATITIASVYLILFRTSLPVVLKTILPFSYIFLYQYAVFGRSYCLLLFFTAAIVSLYSHRFERPWLFSLCVAGLYNTHVLAFAFCTGLTCLYIIDASQEKKWNKQVIFSSVFMLISGLYLIPFLGGSNTITYLQQHLKETNTNYETIIGEGLLASGEQYSQIAMIIFLLLMAGFLKHIKPLLLLICGLSGVFYILGYHYNGMITHYQVLLVIFIGCYGIAWNYDKDRFNRIAGKTPLINYGFYLLSATILVQLPKSCEAYLLDIDNPYSDAKDAAGYLMANTNNKSVIIAQQAMATSSLLPYMPDETRFYYSECGRYGSYYIFDKCYFEQKWAYATDYALDIAYHNFSDQLGNIIIVVNYPLQPKSMKYVDLVYKTMDKPIRWDERYYIYKFKPNIK